MYRWMIVYLLCLIIAVPLYAQDDTPTPYEIALQRIEEARENNATEFHLSYSGLTQLPPEIGQLHNLQVLRLNGNQLTTLPPEIGQLTNLSLLTLSNNQLSNLPPEIGQLNNLQVLWLDNNRLANVPLEIGQMNNLQVLLLYNNQLVSLPPEIGRLTRLCLLGLGHNNLQHLPTSLGNLHLLAQSGTCFDYTFGSGISLDENPLISPPPEVVEQGTDAVLAYLRNQAWYHTQRLIISAAGGVGLFVLLVLGFRWKQRGGRKLKAKRG